MNLCLPIGVPPQSLSEDHCALLRKRERGWKGTERKGREKGRKGEHFVSPEKTEIKFLLRRKTDNIPRASSPW